jgi:hypothetical protein
MRKLSVTRSAAVVVAAVIVGAGLLFGSGTASAGGETRTISAAAAPTAPCTAWNLSSDILYVYSGPDTSSAIWGFLWGGGGIGSSAQCAYTGTSTVWGAHHNLCGGGSLYVAVYFRVGGTYVIAYLPDACVWVTY